MVESHAKNVITIDDCAFVVRHSFFQEQIEVSKANNAKTFGESLFSVFLPCSTFLLFISLFLK